VIYDKYSVDYQVNLCALQEMEEFVPMTLQERQYLRKWVRSGHEIDSNPWDFRDSDGMPLNYLQAFRIEYGYSSGPWDYWKGPDLQPLWCEERKCFLHRDEL